MFRVEMEHECGCYKKSEYTGEKLFQTQQEAYNYSNVLVELMNEEFCSKHLFVSEKMDGDVFLIRVSANPNAGGSCSTGSCGPCGCD